ncbi:MAG: acetoin utilization protein AcuC [Actinomycetota bacterium]|nr:acetoin utilization protein AcuC [Actinomycetota bacterium]
MAEPVQARVVWDPALTAYDFGPTHPMSPIRLDLTSRLCQALGLFDLPQVQVVGAEPVSDAVLLTVHDEAYVAAVKVASADPESAEPLRGLGTEDDPAFPGMHEASARVVGGSLDVAQAVWRGEAAHGVNFSGGLHHAMAERACGFCVYNDVAVAIRWLLDNGAKRVAYVDIDVHHGDGVQEIFWDDPRVLTISVHESGRMLFPGTGFPGELGGPGAEGTAVNVALPAGTGDSGWLRAIHAVAPALVREFRPDALVTQHGCDTHALDPLAHLRMSVDAQRQAASSLHDLAHEVCGGRWVALGGGGYAVIEVVPRTWSHLVGIAAHAPIDPASPVPAAWREHVQSRFGRPGPVTMSDFPAGQAPPSWRSWSLGVDPADPVDQAVLATRQAVFPLHGLDVWFS